MTKKTQGLKSQSKRKSKNITARKVMGRPKRERISDLLTKKQRKMILDKCIQKAEEGDTVMLKSMQEQIWGRPTSTIEAKVEANVSIELVNYGEDSLQL